MNCAYRTAQVSFTCVAVQPVLAASRLTAFARLLTFAASAVGAGFAEGHFAER